MAEWRAPGVGMTSTEFQTPHQITGQTWDSLGLSFPFCTMGTMIPNIYFCSDILYPH